MRSVITSLLGNAFTQRTIPILAIAAVFGVLLAVSTVTSAGPGTTEDVGRDPSAVESGIGPAPFFNHQGSGANFIKAGVTTRVYNSYTNGQTEPFVLTVPALPAGAVVVETFISWNYLLNGVAPANDAITVNGFAANGALVGTGSPDLCWNKDGTASYVVSGATPWVNPGPAPVNVTIAGATDKALGADNNAYGEGLTILVVYEVPGDPSRNVDLYHGYISTQSSPTGPAFATLNYTVQYEGGDFHFFVNGLDGQPAEDDFLIDGVNRSGAVNGTVAVGDAWQGLLGPSATGVENMYDHANDDISAFLTPPDISLDISTQSDGDCVGHSFAAISFPTQPRIPTLTEWGMIIFCVLLFGWKAWVIVRRRKRVTISA